MVKEYKGTATHLSGKGKLTEKIINSLQIFYGIAIRQNSGNLYEMKKAAGAILRHRIGMKDTEVRHQFCPKGDPVVSNIKEIKSHWRKKQKTNLNIPKWIHDVIKSAFIELSSDNLLSKCLHGGKQNSNQSLHSIVWLKCPQNVFAESQTLEIGVFSVVIELNEGSQETHKIAGGH